MTMKRAIIVGVLGLMALGADARGQDASALLKRAADEVSYLSFDKALPLFGEAQKAAQEGSDEWQAAVFGQAICLQQMAPVTFDHLTTASNLYQSLIDRYPKGKYTPESMMALGRIEELVDYLRDEPNREKARQWYAKARDAAGDASDLSHEATLRIAATYVQSFDLDQCRQGMKVLEDWLQRYPDNVLASAMWQYSADTWFWPIGEEKKAIECYIKADTIGLMEKGREGPTYWRIAVLSERNGLRDTAVEYYTKVVTKTPTSGKAYESQLALKRLGAPVPEIKLFQKRNNGQGIAESAETGDKTVQATTKEGAK